MRVRARYHFGKNATSIICHRGCEVALIANCSCVFVRMRQTLQHPYNRLGLTLTGVQIVEVLERDKISGERMRYYTRIASDTDNFCSDCSLREFGLCDVVPRRQGADQATGSRARRFAAGTMLYRQGGVDRRPISYEMAGSG